jgi:hypothetical protein
MALLPPKPTAGCITQLCIQPWPWVVGQTKYRIRYNFSKSTGLFSNSKFFTKNSFTENKNRDISQALHSPEKSPAYNYKYIFHTSTRRKNPLKDSEDNTPKFS